MSEKFSFYFAKVTNYYSVYTENRMLYILDPCNQVIDKIRILITWRWLVKLRKLGPLLFLLHDNLPFIISSSDFESTLAIASYTGLGG